MFLALRKLYYNLVQQRNINYSWNFFNLFTGLELSNKGNFMPISTTVKLLDPALSLLNYKHLIKKALTVIVEESFGIYPCH